MLFNISLDEVGAGVRQKISEGVIKREDMFIASKLWNIFHDPKDVQRAFKMSMDKFDLGYIDLYLMHFPMGFAVTFRLFKFLTQGILYIEA